MQGSRPFELTNLRPRPQGRILLEDLFHHKDRRNNFRRSFHHISDHLTRQAGQLALESIVMRGGMSLLEPQDHRLSPTPLFSSLPWGQICQKPPIAYIFLTHQRFPITKLVIRFYIPIPIRDTHFGGLDIRDFLCDTFFLITLDGVHGPGDRLGLYPFYLSFTASLGCFFSAFPRSTLFFFLFVFVLVSDVELSLSLVDPAQNERADLQGLGLPIWMLSI